MRRAVNIIGILIVSLASVRCDPMMTPTQPTGVQSVTLTPPSATIVAGSTIQLAVSVVADAATAKTVTYTTSAAGVATVDATGRVTGVAAGTATIIATSTADASKAAAAVVTVTGTPVPPGSFLVGTYNISATKTVDTGCNFALGFTGQVQFTLNSDGSSLTLRMIEQLTRLYLGTAQASGSYSMTGSGDLGGFVYTGTVTGQGSATTIQGTETLNFSSGCPGRQVVYTFTGSR